MYAETWGNKAGKKGRIENSEIKKLYYGNNVVLVVLLYFWLIQMEEVLYVFDDGVCSF